MAFIKTFKNSLDMIKRHDIPCPLTVTCMIGKLHSINCNDFMPKALEWENSGTVPYITISNMRLHRKNSGHGKLNALFSSLIYIFLQPGKKSSGKFPSCLWSKIQDVKKASIRQATS